MESRFLRLKGCCLSILLFSAASCCLSLELKKPQGEKEFCHEILRLEKLAHEDPVTSVRAKSHLQLASLYVNSRNPQLNYSRALQEMESYLSLSSAKTKTDDFQNWLAVLKELERAQKDRRGIEEKKQDLQTQIEKLKISLKKIQEVNKNLSDEVVNLQVMIEELKNLDYQMEEKRNLIK